MRQDFYKLYLAPMLKYMYLLFALALIVSCKEKKAEEVIDEVVVVEINTKKLPKALSLNSKVTAEIENWAEYNAFETSFDALYKVTNKEGLAVVIEDLVEKQKLLAASKYPDVFNIAQIKSRQNVVKTYILKTKGSLEYDIDVDEPLKELAIAYNGYRNQFNVTVNYTLDTKLILDEE